MKRLIIVLCVLSLFLILISFANSGFLRAEEKIDSSEVLQKLNEVLTKQDEILKQLAEIKQELSIVKVRATRSR